MPANTIPAPTVRFKIGWIALLVVAALTTLGHTVMIFALDEPNLFTGFAAFNLYSLAVILIPFRRLERWAWLVTWVLPIGLAVPAATDANLTIYYFGIAAVCVLGLLLTMRDFFSAKR
jgi:hypothetical protein